MLDVEEFAHSKIGPGTLYTALSRLVENKWVEAGPLEGRQRPYTLTALGEAHLREQLTAMRRLSNAGLRRLCTT